MANNSKYLREERRLMKIQRRRTAAPPGRRATMVWGSKPKPAPKPAPSKTDLGAMLKAIQSIPGKWSGATESYKKLLKALGKK